MVEKLACDLLNDLTEQKNKNKYEVQFTSPHDTKAGGYQTNTMYPKRRQIMIVAHDIGGIIVKKVGPSWPILAVHLTP